MKYLIKLEQLALFILSGYLFQQNFDNLLILAALWILPDLSAVGYLINTKIGSYTYNLVHHQAIPILILIGGLHFANDPMLLVSLVMLNHSSLDRVLGYGLKHQDDFKHTHLD